MLSPFSRRTQDTLCVVRKCICDDRPSACQTSITNKVVVHVYVRAVFFFINFVYFAQVQNQNFVLFFTKDKGLTMCGISLYNAIFIQEFLDCFRNKLFIFKTRVVIVVLQFRYTFEWYFRTMLKAFSINE